MSYYKDKIVVITGASSGIGNAIAQALDHEGARLILLGRNQGKLKKEIPLTGVHNFFTVDLENEEEITAFADHALKEYRQIDILIHSAGVIHLGTIETLPVKKLDEQYNVNVKAPFLLTQKLLALVKTATGQIVFLNSTAGLHTKELLGSYSASKFALKAIADSLRLELRRDEVNVLSIFLGAAATPMQEKIQKDSGKSYREEEFMSASNIARKVLLVMQNGKEATVTDVTIKDQESFRSID